MEDKTNITTRDIYMLAFKDSRTAIKYMAICSTLVDIISKIISTIIFIGALASYLDYYIHKSDYKLSTILLVITFCFILEIFTLIITNYSTNLYIKNTLDWLAARYDYYKTMIECIASSKEEMKLHLSNLQDILRIGYKNLE